MKYCNKVEVILFLRYSLKDLRQKELVRWLGTTAQTAITKQKQRAKRIFLKTLKDTPAIYLS